MTDRDLMQRSQFLMIPSSSSSDIDTNIKKENVISNLGKTEEEGYKSSM